MIAFRSFFEELCADMPDFYLVQSKLFIFQRKRRGPQQIVEPLLFAIAVSMPAEISGWHLYNIHVLILRHSLSSIYLYG